MFTEFVADTQIIHPADDSWSNRRSKLQASLTRRELGIGNRVLQNERLLPYRKNSAAPWNHLSKVRQKYGEAPFSHPHAMMW